MGEISKISVPKNSWNMMSSSKNYRNCGATLSCSPDTKLQNRSKIFLRSRKFRFRELLGMWRHILRIAEIMPISYVVTFSWCKIAISTDTFLVSTTIFCSQKEFENSLNCGYWKNFKWSNVLFICKISWFYSI